MSGYPHPIKVAELRQCAERVRDADAEIARLRVLIATSQSELEKVEHVWRTNSNEICKLLTAMDCQPGGNYGSENRMVALFAELLTQVAATQGGGTKA